MRKQGHQPYRHGNPEADLYRQRQGSVGEQEPARKTGRISSEEKISSLRESSFEDLTPGRDPAEGPDVAFTSPSHERIAQCTSQRDPTEGAASEQQRNRPPHLKKR